MPLRTFTKFCRFPPKASLPPPVPRPGSIPVLLEVVELEEDRELLLDTFEAELELVALFALCALLALFALSERSEAAAREADATLAEDLDA